MSTTKETNMIAAIDKNIAQVNSDFKDIKDVVERESDCDLTGVPSREYAAKIEAGYKTRFDAGYSKGYNIGHDDGYTSGMDAGLKIFWDGYLQNGNRRNFNQAFAGVGWFPEIFKPNHDLIVNDGYAMFTTNSNTTDLVKTFADLGITLDTSSSVAMGNFFYNNSYLTHAPELSFESIRPSQSSSSVFSGCIRLTTIDGLILKNDGSVKFTNWFQNCNKLTTIREIRGVIGKDINLQWCDLDFDTTVRLFQCLNWFAPEDHEYMTHTITLSAKTWEHTYGPEWYKWFDADGEYLCEYAGWLEG